MMSVRFLCVLVTGLTCCLINTARCETVQPRQWEFSRNNDSKGWNVAGNSRVTVAGGSLWLHLETSERDPAELKGWWYQFSGDSVTADLISPDNLNFAPVAGKVLAIKLRLLNLSPNTDLFLALRSVGQASPPALPKEKRTKFSFPGDGHVALDPQSSHWQDVVLYANRSPKEAIEQFALCIPQTLRGDLWIQSIQIDYADPPKPPARLDVASEAVVPVVVIPGISQREFAGAFKSLDRALVSDVPIFGFSRPFMSPSGYYSKGGWWLTDSALAVAGTKWTSSAFAEGTILNFADVQSQNPDGRIDEWAHASVRGQPGDLSEYPSLFESAYDIARRTDSGQVRQRAYESMAKYLDWWLSSVKRDRATGLISGLFEESFDVITLHLLGTAVQDLELQTIAPVDLNVAVAVGAARTADLALALGRTADAQRYREAFANLSTAINRFLWDEKTGAYYGYNLHTAKHLNRLSVSTFDPLRLEIAPAKRRQRLLARLVDPKQFNWGKFPLTSIAMTDSAYTEARGDYDGTAWLGNVWTLRNAQVISGLDESGRPDLAGELNWATIKAFNNNYREYLLPSTGEGLGAHDYTWTASQYIQMIVENLFGIDFDQSRHRLKIRPHIPKALYGKDLSIQNLILPTPGQTRLSVQIRQVSSRSARMSVSIEGDLPEGDVEAGIPGHKTAVARIQRQVIVEAVGESVSVR